jgi:hypothetical protein
MADVDEKITGSIDVLIEYKKGGLTLPQAIDRFRKLTGLTPDIAEKFIRGLNRDNVISLQTKRKILDEQKETDDD